MGKSFTIANPDPEDYGFCKQLSKDISSNPDEPVKMSRVLSILVSNYKQKENTGPSAELMAKIADLEAQNTQLNHQNFSLQTEKTILEEKIQAIQAGNAAQTEIKFPSFVFTPDPSLLKSIQRYFALMRKRKKLEQPNPEELTKTSIKYYLKNEFPEIF